METAAKFAADAGVLERLAAAASLAGFTLGAVRRAELCDTYVDTADQALLKAGHACRLRRGEQVLQPRDWPAGEARDLVLRIAGEAPLEVLMEVHQTRLLRAVTQAEREVAELGLYEVTVSTRHGALPPYCEVEVQLRPNGDGKLLEALTAALRDDLGLKPEARAISARALQAVRSWPAGGPAQVEPTEQSVTAARAGNDCDVGIVSAAAISDADPRSGPGLTAADTMAAAALKTLRFHFARMLDNEAGTRSGKDPEDLHDMRVATRRMRAAMSVFEGHLEPSALRPIERGLRRTGRVLGAVRDLDVFHEKTTRYLDLLPEGRRHELDPLLEAWRAEREQARRRLLEYLDGERYRRFVECAARFLEEPGAAELPALTPQGEVVAQRVANVLPAVVYTRMGAVWAYAAALAEPDLPLVRYHRLRISGKFLRYTLEFFEEVLGEDARPLIKAVKELQDHLGDVQDAVVSRGVLHSFLRWGAWQRPKRAGRTKSPGMVVPGVSLYLASRQQELQRLLDTFPATWQKVSGPEFRQRLAAVIGALPG